MAGSTTDFVQQCKETKPQRDPRFYWGIGWGADMNGFAHQGAPARAAANPVTYPFKSFDGRQTIDKQRSGQRVYDINVDGVAHYGLFPDWVEDLRHIGGQEIVDDLGRGAEAYLQMWERADGVPPTRCQPAKGRATRRGLTRVRLGARRGALLRRAGQPRTRGRTWTWCTVGGKARIAAVLIPGGRVTTVGSTAPRPRARGCRPRRPARPSARRRARSRSAAGCGSRKLGGGRRAVRADAQGHACAGSAVTTREARARPYAATRGPPGLR